MRALALIAVGLLAACGGLDNRPLTTGAVTGRAAECDGTGVVGIVGDSTLHVAPDASCNFRIEGLQPGAYHLFVAPTAKKVELVTITVEATMLTEVGDVVGKSGAFVRARISAPGSIELDGTLTAPDLPISSAAVGRSGMARIGPFPAGCFRVEVTLNGLGQKSATSCLAEGDEQDVDFNY